MDQEKSSAEVTNIFPGSPKMLVIKCRQNEYVSSPMPSLYIQLKKFANIKDTGTFQFQLPLDRMSKRIIKRFCDILLSSIVIVGVLSWLIPIMALLIKLDSKGPVFFLQKNKRGGKTFTCVKFRSMIENDEADMQATADDERITKLGRFLRNDYLDELPQFFNVLIGDMSLIGPRPHRLVIIINMKS